MVRVVPGVGGGQYWDRGLDDSRRFGSWRWGSAVTGGEGQGDKGIYDVLCNAILIVHCSPPLINDHPTGGFILLDSGFRQNDEY